MHRLHEPEGGLIVDGVLVKAPVSVTNFQVLNVPRFELRGRIKEHRHIVLHENAGSINKEQLYKWLKKKGYGYHIIIDAEGNVTQHADLFDRIWHGGKANSYSVGIVTLNPYYPHLVNTKEEKKFFKLVPAKWWTHCVKGDKRYSKLTEAQIDMLKKLVPFLCTVLDIPFTFPTKKLNRKQRRIKRWFVPRVLPAPGVIAHRDYSRHADGRYALERLQEVTVCPTCGKDF